MIRAASLLLVLAACGTGEDGRTSIVFSVTGDEALAAADTFALFVDPSEPFAASDGAVGYRSPAASADSMFWRDPSTLKSPIGTMTAA